MNISPSESALPWSVRPKPERVPNLETLRIELPHILRLYDDGEKAELESRVAREYRGDIIPALQKIRALADYREEARLLEHLAGKFVQSKERYLNLQRESISMFLDAKFEALLGREDSGESLSEDEKTLTARFRVLSVESGKSEVSMGLAKLLMWYFTATISKQSDELEFRRFMRLAWRCFGAQMKQVQLNEFNSFDKFLSRPESGAESMATACPEDASAIDNNSFATQYSFYDQFKMAIYTICCSESDLTAIKAGGLLPKEGPSVLQCYMDKTLSEIARIRGIELPTEYGEDGS